MNIKEYARSKFKDRLCELYNERWKPKSQKDFANAMNELYLREDKDPNCTHQQISNWLRGEKIPKDETLKYISEVLGVDPEYFSFTLRSENEEYDEDYIKDRDSNYIRHAHSLGINPYFLNYVVKKKDNWKTFPFTNPSPVPHNENGSHPLDQIVVDDNSVKIQLCDEDLNFIKEIQNEVEKTISYMYWRRSQELREESRTRNIELYSRMTDLSKEKIQELINTHRPDIASDVCSDTSDIYNAIMKYVEDNGITLKYIPTEYVHYDVDPEVHKLNKLSGMTDEELSLFYKECEQFERDLHRDAEKECQRNIENINTKNREEYLKRRTENGEH